MQENNMWSFINNSSDYKKDEIVTYKRVFSIKEKDGRKYIKQD